MEQISISVLAVAIVVFAAPLFVDLALCIGGNSSGRDGRAQPRSGRSDWRLLFRHMTKRP